MDASRTSKNIRITIQDKIGNDVTVDGITYPIYHNYVFADPDDKRSPDARTQSPAWVESTFVSQTAGRRGFSLLQLDVFSKVGGESEDDNDPFGMRAEDIADALEDLFSGLNNQGRHKSRFHVKNYQNPFNPIDTGVCMLCKNSRGDLGMVEERRISSSEEGLRRITITMRFQLLQDASGPAAFYID
tara:strand:- start:1459 stop:2019 length:561 start_codon:yes stop_codon:yes gene_type:complete